MYLMGCVQQGRGKRKRSGSVGPFLRLLLARHTAQATGAKLGLWLEHHVHLGIPEFIINRSAPTTPQHCPDSQRFRVCIATDTDTGCS